MTGPALTPEQIAHRIGMTAAYVRGLCASGELRARKCGKFWRVDPPDFTSWWDAQQVKPIDDAKVVALATRRGRT